MTYQAPGERQRIVEESRRKAQQQQAVRSQQTAERVNSLVGRLLRGEGSPGQPVEVLRRLPVLAAVFSKSDEVVSSPFGDAGYSNVPIKWQAFYVDSVTRGWPIKPASFSKYISDSRYDDGGQGNDPLPGILTAEGKIYTRFCNLEAIGGFAVFAAIGSVVQPHDLPVNDELARNLEGHLRTGQ